MAFESSIGKAINMGLLLEFESAFPDEVPLRPEQYLKGGKKSFVLNVAAFLLGFKSQDSKFKNKEEILNVFFGAQNEEFYNVILEKIKETEKEGSTIIIVNTYSSLTLFELFFQKEEEKETQTPAEFEVSFFKAYLVLNSEFTKKQYTAFTSTKGLGPDLFIPMMMFCMQYPVSDKANYDIRLIWATQIIKAVYLFKFLESNPKIQHLLAAFLAFFNKASWQDYMHAILPLTTSLITSEHEAHTDITVQNDEQFKANCEFIEKLIVHDDEELDENDFLTLRARPFYKITEGVYRAIFNLFVVEKIFKGVYFLLRDVNATLPKDKQIKELKSFYGDEFSEKVLVYRIFEFIYPENCIKFSGRDFSEMKIDGGPDYYVRKGKDILLIESKDFLIKANNKGSFDYKVYETEFKRVLYFETLPNGKEKFKAIKQLIANVRAVLRKELAADIDYNSNDTNIYPVLLTHDHQYDTPGFSDLLNAWFRFELNKLKADGLFIQNVQPLVCVNVDSLLYHQIGLSHAIKLHEILKLYIDETKLDSSMSKLVPFSIYVDRLFHKLGIHKAPPILELLGPALFKAKA